MPQNGISGNLLDILSDFLRDTKQTVVLNGQKSTWEKVSAGVPQASILGPLLFLIHINDLSGDLSSKTELFADDIFLFNVAHDINTLANKLNNDLKEVSNWAFQWKMTFNLEQSKQTQEVIFSRKFKKVPHPLLVINNTVFLCKSQKHLGIILDSKFEDHYKTVLSKTNRTLELLHKLQNLLPIEAFITIYKAFVRPHVDYGDVLFHEAFSTSSHEKLEYIQDSACLALTGTVRGSSKEKLYE